MSESDVTKEPTAPAPAGENAPAPAAGQPAIPPPAEAAATAAAEIETLRRERNDFHDRYLRALADLDNYRRRVIREKDELRQFAVKGLVESLVPVVEHLGMAIASAKQTSDPQVIAQGVAMVLEQFRGALSAVGLAEINPANGADFDPHQHESLAHAPSDTVPEEKIVQVVRPGFSLNGRLLRPASVVLSSGKGPATDTAGAPPAK